MEERKIVSYRDVWKIKNCRQLILSNLVNRFGDSIDAIAFVWLASMERLMLLQHHPFH